MDMAIPKHVRPAYPAPVERGQVRGKVMELLGLEEVPEAADFTVASVETEDGLVVTRGSFRTYLGEDVPTIMMTPTGASGRPRAGVVCVPGTGGSAEMLAHERLHVREEGRLFGWGRELARRGFATIAITPKGTEARRGSEEAWAHEMKLLAPYGRSQMGVLVEETLLAARILADAEGVDAGRIALTGMSLGGNASWYAIACAPWIAAAAPVCGGLGRMERVIHEGQNERHSAYYFIPHMLRHFDHPEVVAACIAPRPLFMVAPTEDEDMPRSGVDDLVPVVRKAYEEMGKPEQFTVYHPEGRHVYRVGYLERVAAWLRWALGEE